MIEYKTIGIIHSPHKEAKGTPIQSAVAAGIKGKIEVFPEYNEGLQDLDGFSHIFLLYHLHLIKEPSLKVKPFLDDQMRGVFATRSPKRPNSIGLSIVRLTKIEEATIYIEDVDILDGAPLLDIKPYIPEFDHRDVEKEGWVKNKLDMLPSAKDDGRFV